MIYSICGCLGTSPVNEFCQYLVSWWTFPRSSWPDPGQFLVGF